MKVGDRVFQVFTSMSVKKIIEFEIIKINPKTIEVVGENGRKMVKISNFEKHREGAMFDSFLQWTKTLQEADILSIQLMDLVSNRKYDKMQAIKKDLESAISIRNSAPTIRRME